MRSRQRFASRRPKRQYARSNTLSRVIPRSLGGMTGSRCQTPASSFVGYDAMYFAVSSRISAQRSSVACVGRFLYSSSAKIIGCGCFQSKT